MPTHTSTASPQDVEELYNTLMWNIEPELTTWILPDLEDLYNGETTEERKERFAWYSRAFGIFLDTYKEFKVVCRERIEKIQKELTRMAQDESIKKDHSEISSIERSLDQA